MYTLREPGFTIPWTQAVLRLRRSSDSDQKYVFFDTNGEISLTSFTGNTPTVASAVTLATWVGANNAQVAIWEGLTPNNTIDTNLSVVQGTAGNQPTFITAGVIEVKNSLVAIDFLNSSRYLSASGGNPDLNDGNSYTILTVTATDDSTTNNVILNTRLASGGVSDRFVIYNDRRTNKLQSVIKNSLGTNQIQTYTAQENTANQKLQTVIGTPTNLKGYYNGTLQQNVAVTDTYTNDTTQIGIDRGTSNPFDGTMQEIIIFPTDKTSDLVALHAEINAYYSIY
tara:strand:+ start:3954 stop:4802 length:849 start_codon:yes stop_codon:yes gene_type:complete